MLIKPLIVFCALAVSLPAYAVMDEKTIELKDGTILVIQTDGKMRHVDQRGHAVTMRENMTMEAKDGNTYMMKNSAIWQQLYSKGTLNPKQ